MSTGAVLHGLDCTASLDVSSVAAFKVNPDIPWRDGFLQSTTLGDAPSSQDSVHTHVFVRVCACAWGGPSLRSGHASGNCAHGGRGVGEPRDGQGCGNKER